MPEPSRKKLRRAARACDFCSKRNIKCRPSETSSSNQCESCEDFGSVCTFHRPIRKRGAKPKSQRLQDTQNGPNPPHPIPSPELQVGTSRLSSPRGSSYPTYGQALSQRHGADVAAVSPATVRSTHESISGQYNHHPNTSSNNPRLWNPPQIASQAITMDLAEIFFEISYPVFPLFHRPTLLRRVSRGEYLDDRSLYTSVMAMCALTSARIRDGALYSKTWDAESLKDPPSEAFFKAAQDAIPSDAPLSQDLGHMRASVLLAITSIQYGHSTAMNYWLGTYHTFVAVGSLHDESHWPPNITTVEIEERRRLYWSTYTLDVFTSSIWGGILRSREASSKVSYPTELDDEEISMDGYKETSPARTNWLQGWNFVTDLYRILEHAQEQFCNQRTDPDHRHPRLSLLFHPPEIIKPISSHAAVLAHAMNAYEALPEIFKRTRPITCDLKTDLFSFQSANIAATVQLVRMVLFTLGRQCGMTGTTVEQKCAVAREVIAGFVSVPVEYLRAISAPLLHHLGGIGTILGSAFEDEMTDRQYKNVRDLLLQLADLLHGLEAELWCPLGVAENLRKQVQHLDEYMVEVRQQRGHLIVATTNSALPMASNPDPNNAAAAAASLQHTTSLPQTDQGESPYYHFPSELFKDWDWSWAVDWTV